VVKVLDSDHCVAILRGKLNLTDQVAPSEELAVTAISVGELTHGTHKSARTLENLTRLDVLLSRVTILAFDEPAARRFGKLKADLERAGASVGDLDLQIASIALENGALLVTHNRKHFDRVPGLVLEDWL
jgi:tRNA(fMet)-specific endonuclease VapC